MRLQQDNDMLREQIMSLTFETENQGKMDNTTANTETDVEHENKELSDKVTSLRQRVKEYQQMERGLKKEDKRNKHCNERLIKYQAENEYLKSQIKEAHAINNELSKKLNVAESDKCIYKQKMQDNDEVLKQTEVENKQLHDSLDRNIRNVDEEIQSYKDNSHRLNLELEFAIHTIKHEAEKHKRLMAEKDQIINKLEGMKRKRSSESADLEKVSTASTYCRQLEHQLGSANSEIKSIKAELDDAKTR